MNGTPDLQIDRRMVAAPVSDTDFRMWMADRRPFISSVMEALKAERLAAIEALRDLGAQPVYFERFGGRDDDPEVAYLAEVKTATDYLGILDRDYGRINANALSATHSEFREAVELGLTKSVWVGPSNTKQAKQLELIDEVRRFNTTGNYSTPDELADGIAAEYKRLASESLSPWAKLGNQVFRARSVRKNSTEITVDALVGDPDVLTALESLGGSQFGGRQVTFTDSRSSEIVSVQQTTVTSSNSMVNEVQIKLRRQNSFGTTSMPMTYNDGSKTYKPADITERMLRVSLFGEPHDLGLMRYLVEKTNVLAQLSGMGLTQAVTQSIGRLLVIELLGAESEGASLRLFELGPPNGGRRNLRIEWQTAPDHTHPSGERRCIEDQVQIA